MVNFTQTIVATGETTDVFGKASRGFLNYGRDGCMMGMIVKDERAKPADLAKMTDQERAELFKTIFARASKYDGVSVEFAPELLQGGPARHCIVYDPSGIGIEFIWAP